MIADFEDQVISTFQAIFVRLGCLGVAGLLAFLTMRSPWQ